MKFDPEVFRAAIQELRPVCRTVFILFVREEMNPVEIVMYLARQGIVLDTVEVSLYLSYAARHCERRLAEAELLQRLSGDRPAASGSSEHKGNLMGGSSYIWVDGASPPWVTKH